LAREGRMTVTIGRRELLVALGGAAAAWPLAARAQQTAMPVIGYLSALSESQIPNLIETLRQGLSENGFVEGTSVIIDYRFAEGEYGRLQTFATEFVRQPVSLIIAVGPPAAFADGKSGFMLDVFSRAPKLRICQCSSRLHSSWSSILRLQRRRASRCTQC